MSSFIKNIRFLLATFCMILWLVSCKSGKTVVHESAEALKGEAQWEAVLANTPLFDSFSSGLRMTVPLKKSDYTLNGTFKIQRDQFIQISLLMPILRTEVARIEISPELFLVIDRMNKRYAAVPVSELREYFHTEVDFQMLQSLFSNGLFLPGKYKLSREDYFSFYVQKKGEDAVELSQKSHEFVYSFLTSSLTNHLIESTVETHSSKYFLQWKYDNFVPVGETVFPSEMQIQLGRKENPTRTFMELSRLSVDKQTLSPTDIPGRYEQIELNDLIKMLDKMMQ